MIQPLPVYEYLALSRQRVLDAVRPLDAEAYARPFPIGPGTLARTLTHSLISEWYYVQRMQRRDVPPYEQWPIRDEHPPALDALEAAWREQAEQTRAALAEARDWDAPFEYHVTDDDGAPLIVTATPAGLFTQLALHEVHHRAQAVNILRHLGITLGDIDFNAIMFPRRRA